MAYIPDHDLQSEQVDFGEGDVTVYFRKMCLFEMDLVDKASQKSKVDGIVETLMVRAKNEDGSRMFEKKDRSRVLRKFDPDAVLFIVNAMNTADGGESGN